MEEGTEDRVRVSKGDHIGLEKVDSYKKGYQGRGKREGSQLIGPRHTFFAH